MADARDHAILEEVYAERAFQDGKWGAERHQNVLEWLGILAEEFGEFSKEAVEYHFTGTYGRTPAHYHQRMRAELIQVAAVAVAIVQALDRNAVPQ